MEVECYDGWGVRGGQVRLRYDGISPGGESIPVLILTAVGVVCDRLYVFDAGGGFVFIAAWLPRFRT